MGASQPPTTTSGRPSPSRSPTATARGCSGAGNSVHVKPYASLALTNTVASHVPRLRNSCSVGPLDLRDSCNARTHSSVPLSVGHTIETPRDTDSAAHTHVVTMRSTRPSELKSTGMTWCCQVIGGNASPPTFQPPTEVTAPTPSTASASAKPSACDAHRARQRRRSHCGRGVNTGSAHGTQDPTPQNQCEQHDSDAAPTPRRRTLVQLCHNASPAGQRRRR